MFIYTDYQLYEKGDESVSGTWKGCQIFLLLMGAVFSVVCSVFVHILVATFDMTCILNPRNIVFLNTSSDHQRAPTLNSTYKHTDLPVDYINSQWANINDCYGALYNPVLSVIFGIVWSTFFMMCSKGGRSISGLKQPWRIVLPAAIFSFIYSILCIVISAGLTNGLESFDEKFKNITGIDDIQYRTEVATIDAYVLISVIMTWLYTLCWIFSFLLLILRCIIMPDFQLMQLRVELIKGGDNEAIVPKEIENEASPMLTHSDRPSTSTGITSNSILVHVNVEPVKLNNHIVANKKNNGTLTKRSNTKETIEEENSTDPSASLSPTTSLLDFKNDRSNIYLSLTDIPMPNMKITVNPIDKC